jgi:hypothetical protein
MRDLDPVTEGRLQQRQQLNARELPMLDFGRTHI